MRIGKLPVSLALFFVVAGALVAAAPTAAALTPGQRVTAANSEHGAVSWQTPALNGRHSRVVNTSGTTHASTIITLADAAASTSYSFAVTLPPHSGLALRSDGSVAVLTAGKAVGSFLPPWAKDARGTALATHFTLTGNVLTQHVETRGAVFPVTADPHYTWGWVTGTVYYNKHETMVANNLWYVAGPLCTGVGAWFVPAGVYCGVIAGSITAVAHVATSEGRCLKIKAVPGNVALLQPGIYSGGDCR
ncbi:hypothetical protein BH10ACT8_BH10ACT8_00650 [soil metagenome]